MGVLSPAQPTRQTLGGPWGWRRGTEEGRRTFSSPDLDDSEWERLDPGVLTPGTLPPGTPQPWLPGDPESAMLRQWVAVEDLEPRERLWLVVATSAPLAEVWWNDRYLGDVEGPWGEDTFEITAPPSRGGPLPRRGQALLAVDLWRPAPGTAGPVLRAMMVRTGPLRITSVQVLHISPVGDQMGLRASVSVTADRPERCEIATAIGAADPTRQTFDLAAGINAVEVEAVSPPMGAGAPWFPHALGGAQTTGLALSASAQGAPSDALTIPIGLRTLAWNPRVGRRGAWEVNGHPIFLRTWRGAPRGTDPADVVAHGVDLVEVDAFSTAESFWGGADRAGLLVAAHVAEPERGAGDAGFRDRLQSLVRVLHTHPSLLCWVAPSDRVRDLLADLDPLHPAIGGGWTDRPWFRMRSPSLGPIIPDSAGTPVRSSEFHRVRRFDLAPGVGVVGTSIPLMLPGDLPAIVVADPLPARLGPGEPLALDVHAINEGADDLTDCILTAVLSWDGGEHTWRWEGDAPAGYARRVGTLQFAAPVRVGPLTLDLVLDGSVDGRPGRVSNRYTAEVAAPAH